ncbi:surfeit locus protein 1 [Tetranychus urticae]|uniref:SURF1-like protein n=1 Tax=Tetranychus urticae TaxID=32264 RepID=T1KA19_TETUR|nr:surfeit locus protein 1 [Tetranychus urticae]
MFRSLRSIQSKGSLYFKRKFGIKNEKLFKDGPKQVRDPVTLADYFLFSIPLTTFCLGTWQVKRYKWKQELKAELKDQLSKEPVPLPEDLRKVDDMVYQRVLLRGHFDHSKEQFIGPRVLQRESAVAAASMLSGNANGYYVVTPFVLADRNYSVLINRGWIPKERLNPNTRKEGQVEDEVTITGILRRSETADNSSSAREPNGIWLRRDIEQIARYVEAAPVMIDADLDSSIKGGPIGGQTRVDLPDNHLSYMITWYALTLITAYLCAKRIYVKKNPILV